MRQVNHWYGHSQAFVRYTGLHQPSPIWGYLQHGYNIDIGVPYPDMVGWLPKLVWNSRNAEAAARSRLRNVVPIGAPFLYLLNATDLDVLPGEPPRQATTTLVYLTHAGFRGDVMGDHARFAAAVRERESGRVVLSVHWMDSDKRDVLRNYVDAGFELVFSGHRLDPKYLEKQLQRLLSASRVVADQLGTGLLYAAALGREVEIYGQPFTHSRRADWAEKIGQFTRLHVPELLDGPLRGEDARQVARRELGADHARSPEELRQILGWSGVRWRVRRSGRYAALSRRRVLKVARLLKIAGPADLPADLQGHPESVIPEQRPRSPRSVPR